MRRILSIIALAFLILQLSIASARATTLQNHLWNVLTDLGASGSAASRSFGVCAAGVGGCVGNGSTDDTVAIRTLHAAGNMLIGPGTYKMGALGGDRAAVDMTSNRVVLCQPGATIYDPLQNGAPGGNPSYLFYSVGGASNVLFIGCKMTGNFSFANEIFFGAYNELIEFRQGSGGQINGVGLEMSLCDGDCWIPDSNNSSSTSGPTDWALTFSNVAGPTSQQGIHPNGGQGGHVIFSQGTDTNYHAEIDSGLNQIIGVAWSHIFFRAIGGQEDNCGGNCGSGPNPPTWDHPNFTCTAHDGIGMNAGLCFGNNVRIDGASTTTANGGPWWPNFWNFTNVTSGCVPPHYAGNIVINNGIMTPFPFTC